MGYNLWTGTQPPLFANGRLNSQPGALRAFANLLCVSRVAGELTKRQLAKITAIALDRLGQLEKALASPTPEELRAIGAVLGEYMPEINK